jgi:GNAT superfamily N-acetyltransferase
MDDLQILCLEPREWVAAFPIIAQLRPRLIAEEFLAQARRQSHSGYEHVGAFHDGRLIGVLGMRPVHTLVRGPYLHVDDIIIEESERRSGGGRALMAYAEADATARGMTAVFLDARPDAIAFYQAPLGSGTIRRTLGAQADETASAVATSASAPCRSF